MRRRLFNVLGALSLTICVTTAALWVRSTIRGDQLQIDGGGGDVVRVRTVGGMFVINTVDVPGKSLLLDGPTFAVRSDARSAFNTRFTNGDPWSRAGFWWLRFDAQFGGTTGTVTWVSIPHWFITLVSGVVGGWRLRRTWRNRAPVRWRAQGRCGHCGYDIRATPERCPECGTAP